MDLNETNLSDTDDVTNSGKEDYNEIRKVTAKSTIEYWTCI